MGKEKIVRKMTKEQRQTRTYRVIFFVISFIVLLTMILSLIAR